MQALDASANLFEKYWASGNLMASAYAKDGTSAGNKMMPAFDEASGHLSARLDPFIKQQTEQFNAAIANVQSANYWVSHTVIVGGLLLCVVTVIFSLFGSRSITQPIHEAVALLREGTVETTSVA